MLIGPFVRSTGTLRLRLRYLYPSQHVGSGSDGEDRSGQEFRESDA
jgi:hypothetical protein